MQVDEQRVIAGLVDSDLLLDEPDVQVLWYLYAHHLASTDSIARALGSTVREITARLHRLRSARLVVLGPLRQQYSLSDRAESALNELRMMEEKQRDRIEHRLLEILPASQDEAISFRRIRSLLADVSPRDLRRVLESLIRSGKVQRIIAPTVSGKYRYFCRGD
jgi:DNA-binding HxlR family transcriptional regulator